MNAAHTLAYSIVGLQEMNLAYKYPIIYWNTANLIVDSGSMNLSEEITSAINDDDDDIENSSTNYGKIATAIGNMKNKGINFSLPDINKSDITFTPIVSSNEILYGLRGLTRIGNQLIKEIISKRPYESMEDFTSKVKVNKLQMLSLIKAGTFDNLYDNDRKAIMKTYIESIADKKKRITLQNMQMLISHDLIPNELAHEVKVFNFNKYLKHFPDKYNQSSVYKLDNRAMRFFMSNYDESNLLQVTIDNNESVGYIKQSVWNKIYQSELNPVRDWMKNNQQEILDKLNQALFKETYDKYALGNESKWEMDSLSFYYHPHELANLQYDLYDVTNFFSLPQEPEIEKVFGTKSGDEIRMFKISRIAGTVIDKDKNKGSVSLLTNEGVVIVKVWKNQFAAWDKQISERDAEGTKHVLEKSWFQRGNKLIITGVRREDNFIPKKYKSTPYPLFEIIDDIDEKGIITKSRTERIEVDE